MPGPNYVVRLTWFVTDKRAYLADAKRVGEIYRRVMGRNFPTMSVVQVVALVEDDALVEIEATAVVPDNAPYVFDLGLSRSFRPVPAASSAASAVMKISCPARPGRKDRGRSLVQGFFVAGALRRFAAFGSSGPENLSS